MKNFKLFTLLAIILLSSCTNSQAGKALLNEQPIEHEIYYYDYHIGGIQWTDINDKTYKESEEAYGYFRVIGEMDVICLYFDSYNYHAQNEYFLIIESQYEREGSDVLLRGYARGSDNYLYEWSLRNSGILQYIDTFKLKRIDDDKVLTLYFYEPQQE